MIPDIVKPASILDLESIIYFLLLFKLDLCFLGFIAEYWTYSLASFLKLNN